MSLWWCPHHQGGGAYTNPHDFRSEPAKKIRPVGPRPTTIAAGLEDRRPFGRDPDRDHVWCVHPQKDTCRHPRCRSTVIA